MSTFYKTLFALLVIAFSGGSNAAIITVYGNTVSFTYNDAQLGLFGEPSVSGDQLFFTPTTFVAEAHGVDDFNVTNSTINVKITALNNGAKIGLVNLTERGDYYSRGSTSFVDAGGQIRVADLSAPASEATDPIIQHWAFTQTDYILPTRNWEASASADVSGFGTNSVNVTIEDILIAETNASQHNSFIEKKGVILGVSAVPLPQAVWLFGTGLLGLLSIAKRKNLV